MVEVDERGDDHRGHEDPQRERENPSVMIEMPPHGVEQDSGQEFDQRIADGDGLAAEAALPTQREPGKDGQVMEPLELVFAVRAEGTLGFVDRHAEGQTVDADVQERTDDRAEYERENVEEPVVVNRRDGGRIGERQNSE